LFYKGRRQKEVNSKNLPRYFNWYESGLKFVLRRQFASLTIVVLMLAAAVFLGRELKISQFPAVSHDEILLEVDWNEPVTLDENNARIGEMLLGLQPNLVYVIEEAGRQQYLLNSSEEAGTSENKLFLKAASPRELDEIIEKLSSLFGQRYPEADISFTESDNLFNLAFGKTEAPLIVRFTHFNPSREGYLNELAELQKKMSTLFPGKVQSKLITRDLILLETDPEKLLLYQVDNNELFRQVKSAFDANTVFTINDNNTFIPVSIGNSYASIYEIVKNITVTNDNGEQIPLSGLVKVSSGTGLKSIVAGKESEYFPVLLDIGSDEYSEATQRIENEITDENFDISYGGSILSGKGMLKELLLIVAVSLLLLYFILAAQFESFVLPLIVLFEVPIDLFGAFLFLALFGAGINIMSAIGIIVMAGIIINDSILKIDTINKQMDEGNSLVRSIFIGGQRRLKPILMTSLTTILAMTPFLFQKGMGAELQKPLALAIIGGMIVGTLVSLYFIPLMYYLLKRKN